MKSLFLTMLSIALATGCGKNSSDDDEDRKPDTPLKANQAIPADVQAVALGNNDFAFNLHRQLGGDGNLFFSPMSISTALSMTYAGARGETAAEMAKTLRYPFEGERLHLGYAGLLGKLSGDDRPTGVTLSVANSLWGADDFDEKFLALNRDCYAAHLRKVELVGAEPMINKWVEEQTAELIKNLLPPRKLTEASVLVLVNAVYFKGQWQSRFKDSATSEREFRVKPGQSVRTKMMYQTANFRHARIAEADAQLLELPYKGNELSMVIILPKSDDGLPAIEKLATAEKLAEWLKRALVREVELTVPRFKVAGATVSLKDPLQELGMKRPFSDGEAEFGICSKRVFINDVLHKAFVEVNEEGSEAAAATAVEFQFTSRIQPVNFVADHPFLFLIRDTRTGCILFLGRAERSDEGMTVMRCARTREAPKVVLDFAGKNMPKK